MKSRKEPARRNRDALERECAKLDPVEERAMAEEGMTTAPVDWALSCDGIDGRPKAWLIMRILRWLQIGGLIVAAFGLVYFVYPPWRLLQLPNLWPLVLALTGFGLFALATVSRDLARYFQKSGD